MTQECGTESGRSPFAGVSNPHRVPMRFDTSDAALAPYAVRNQPGQLAFPDRVDFPAPCHLPDAYKNSRATSCVIKTKKYNPYAVDWRFLPEEILLSKDYIRHYLAILSNNVAKSKIFSRIWSKTIGSGTVNAVVCAKLLFIHVPKTGGTSISKELYGKNLPHYTAKFWFSTFGDSVGGLPSFAVIRNPVERLLSAYKMAVSGGTDMMAYSRYYRKKLQGLKSIELYVDYVYRNRHCLESLSLDLHEQSSFILDDEGHVLVNRLFSLDNRHGLPVELERWLSVPSIPHLNATMDYPVTITEGTTEKIREIYARDFEIFERLEAGGGSGDLKGIRFSEN